jgi:hypothetical protein
MDNDNGKIKAAITLHDIQRDITELHDAVGALSATVRESITERRAALAEHERQIRTLCEAKVATDVRLDHLETQSKTWGVLNAAAAALAAVVGVFVPRP